MQILVHIFETETLAFASPAVCGSDVKDALAMRHGCPRDAFELSLDGCHINDEDFIPDEFGVVIRGSLSVAGGKGGYGAMLKHLAKQSGAKKTTNFGACRDLSGRRLRHVNDEIILQKWKEARESRKEMDTEEITQTGIDMWFLAAPSWVDGFKKPNPRKKFMKGKKKTRICLDWERARKDGQIPKNAPVWWGCPRGSRCEYAHGEGELPKEVIQELHAKRRQEQRDSANEKRSNYLSATDEAGRSDAEVSEMILAGLQAAKRMKKEESDQLCELDEVLPLCLDCTIDFGLNISQSVASAPVNRSAAVSTSAVEADADAGGSSSNCTWMTVMSGDEAQGAYVPPTTDMNGYVEGNGEDILASVAVTGCFLTEGLWYFEVEAMTEGLIQIGVGDDAVAISAQSGDGVGDDAHSWAFDGARSCVWHDGKESPMGSKHWSVGDVVGVYVSIENVSQVNKEMKKRGRGKPDNEESSAHRELSIGFSINGEYLGNAYTQQHNPESPAQYYYPIVSVESGESARLNIGQWPFKFYRSGIALTGQAESSGAAREYFPVINSLDSDVAASIKDYMSFYSSFEKVEDSSKIAEAFETEHELAADGSLGEARGAEVKEKDEVHFDDVDIDSAEFAESANSFHKFGLAHLKAELERRGLKSSGTLSDRASRLFAVRGVPFDKIDKKYKKAKSNLK